MHLHLQLKNAALAAEIRLIRRKEVARKRNLRKARDARRIQSDDGARSKAGEPLPPDWEAPLTSIYLHRVNVVRPHARTNHLAYCFLRGTPYAECERLCYRKPNFEDVLKFALKFKEVSEQVVRQRYSQWLDEALAWLGDSPSGPWGDVPALTESPAA